MGDEERRGGRGLRLVCDSQDGAGEKDKRGRKVLAARGSFGWKRLIWHA